MILAGNTVGKEMLSAKYKKEKEISLGILSYALDLSR